MWHRHQSLAGALHNVKPRKTCGLHKKVAAQLLFFLKSEFSENVWQVELDNLSKDAGKSCQQVFYSSRDSKRGKEKRQKNILFAGVSKSIKQPLETIYYLLLTDCLGGVSGKCFFLSHHHNCKHVEFPKCFWDFNWNSVLWLDETKIELLTRILLKDAVEDLQYAFALTTNTLKYQLVFS